MQRQNYKKFISVQLFMELTLPLMYTLKQLCQNQLISVMTHVIYQEQHKSICQCPISIY